jgi:hypothetical protein
MLLRYLRCILNNLTHLHDIYHEVIIQDFLNVLQNIKLSTCVLALYVSLDLSDSSSLFRSFKTSIFVESDNISDSFSLH